MFSCVFVDSMDYNVVGIILFLWFWNIIWLCVFTFCHNLHTCAFDARAHTHTHTHTLWHDWVLNVMILSCLDLCLQLSFFFFNFLFKSLFLGLYFNIRCVGTNGLLIKFVIIFCALFCGTCCFVFIDDSKEKEHCTTRWQKEENGQYSIPLYQTF